MPGTGIPDARTQRAVEIAYMQALQAGGAAGPWMDRYPAWTERLLEIALDVERQRRPAPGVVDAVAALLARPLGVRQ